MIQFNESIFNNTIVNKDIDKLLINLYKLCNCDIVSVITLDMDSKLAMSRKILSKNNNCFYYSSKLWKKRLSESYLNKLSLLSDKKQIIFSEKDGLPSEHTLFEKTEEEIFIPIITDKNKLIICLYLSIFDNDNMNKSIKIDKSNADEIFYSLRNLYKILYLSNEKIEIIFDLINIMMEITRRKEPLMVFHPFNVANISKQIAIQLRLCNSKIENIYFGGLFHDIGKLYIDRCILNKTTELTEDEYNVLKKHSIYGYNMLKDIWKEVAIYVKYHHERIDGSGYPYKLKGDEIPIESKIISIADTIDAISSHRSYKHSKGLNFLIAELVHSIGSQFDSEIVDAAIKVITEYRNKDCCELVNFVEAGTITVKTLKNALSVEGIIRKTNFGYIFRADTFNFETDIDVSEIQSIYLYICRNINNIYQYEVVLEHYKENMIYIADIKNIKFNDSFNLLWNLQGDLNLEKFILCKITICKIGGSSLMFYCENELDKALKEQIFNIRIYFSDNCNLVVSGILSKLFKSGINNYYELVYVNTPDTIKDEIFSKMFKRQMEMKSGVRW